VPTEYAADYLEQVLVRDACSRDVVSLRTSDELGEIRGRISSGRPGFQHQGFPVVDDNGRVRGVITRRDLLDPSHPNMRRIGDMLVRAPVVVHENHSLREAADHMVDENIGRVIVVGVDPPHPLIGILTRGDLLSAHRQRLKETHQAGRHIRIRETLRRFPERFRH
jgi:chloride channel protein, CIC family